MEFLNQYWAEIGIITGQLVIILNIIKNLKVRVLDTAKASEGLFNKVKEDIKGVKDNEVLLAHALDVVLTFIEKETELKQLSSVIPQEIKDDYEEIKKLSLGIHNELKDLKG